MLNSNRFLQSVFTWRAFANADALHKRILFTLGALLVYRLGAHIPLAGVDPQQMLNLTQKNIGGFMGMLDMFSGGALGRATIMTLNIIPYITASIIIQLLTVIVPHFENLRKEGETGRRKINQYTRYLTVLLATFEAYGLSVGLETLQHNGASVVLEPGFFFRVTTVITLVGATLFLVWLGEQITSRGLGSGSSMIIYTGIVANLPISIMRTLELGRTGAVNMPVIAFVLILVVMVVSFVVFVERAYRKVVVQYPKRQVGVKLMRGGNSYLPVKLNTAGVLPPIFASSVLMMPTALLGSFSLIKSTNWWSYLSSFLRHGHPVFISLYVALIIFFSFFYTAIVFNPKETAENLQKNHGFVPGYKPGESTRNFFDALLTRLTVLGSAYLAFVCILPELVMSQITVAFFFSGTSLLILVSVTIELLSQVQTHLISYQYAGLLNKQTRKK